jgi:hypothetical protein
VDAFVTAPSQFLSRKQSTTAAKVSTIEAVAIALRQLGEKPPSLLPLYQALHLSVDTGLKLAGKKPAYGNFIRPKVNPGDRSGPYTIPKVKKPPLCLRCGVLRSDEANFKNMGMHIKIASSDSSSPSSPVLEFTGEEKEFYRVWRCGSCSDMFEYPC